MSAADVHRLEYERLKTEQADRLDRRDKLARDAWVAAAAAVGLAVAFTSTVDASR